ncbi:MAG: PilZ domain-containing protein [Nitrobacter sp.]|jgi:hypothetical protein
MTSGDGKRAKPQRVKFSRDIPVRIVAIDGSWTQACVMRDAGQTGAKLEFESPLAHPGLKEFFLLLSATGTAARRCELAWVNGNEIGVKFLGTVALSPRPDTGHHEI